MSLRGLRVGEDGVRVNVGMSTCGLASGARAVYEAFLEASERLGLGAEVVKTGCIGSCFAEPLVEVFTEGGPSWLYSNVTPSMAEDILRAVSREDPKGVWLARRGDDPQQGPGMHPLEGHPFFKHQVRDAIENCGVIDPESIQEYLAVGGYSGLRTALGMEPEEVIEAVSRSGLRGRGGAGFPTGLKWRFTREEAGDLKYVICNADEGDPGAFMNRLNAEGDPHKVLEGLIIAAYAVGAREGFIFVRAEKPLMAERLGKAVAQAEREGFLGEEIMGSDFDFHVTVITSAGAFVCGEETAMLAAIEGRRATPRPRPPFPSSHGLWGRPTCINNVETLAHVPGILVKGPESFASVGTEKSKGTKVFCLTGSIQRSGAVEVPLGTTLRTLVFEVGGGPLEGRRFKAVQTGGPSGGCLSEAHLDLPLDYESLQEAGSIMGSGGIVVIDDTACVVDVAKFFLGFTTAESCGLCTPCRVGLKRMHEVLEAITSGRGEESHLELLRELSQVVKETSLCALGGSAPNPVLTTLNYFEEEYLAHIRGKMCPAGVCVGLRQGYTVDPEACVGCGLCIQECPVEAIQLGSDSKASIQVGLCTGCGRCAQVCPRGAILGGV